jgi:hypothetical protein
MVIQQKHKKINDGRRTILVNQIEMKYQQITCPFRGATYALSAIGTDTPITPWANPLSL